jgi:hypothetical protein
MSQFRNNPKNIAVSAFHYTTSHQSACVALWLLPLSIDKMHGECYARAVEINDAHSLKVK